jgi:hypothetical protein
LVGTWEATSVSYPKGVVTAKEGTGTGFRVTFKCDGTEIVDYANMKPFVLIPENEYTHTNDEIVYMGKAEVRISIEDGRAKIESRLDGNVKMSMKTAGNPEPVDLPYGNLLGPGGLGETSDDNSYSCEADTLSYKGSVQTDLRANLPITFKRVKEQ